MALIGCNAYQLKISAVFCQYILRVKYSACLFCVNLQLLSMNQSHVYEKILPSHFIVVPCICFYFV